MAEIIPFVPGFKTVQEALEAGQDFYAKTTGAKGRFQRDFHITANEHGRFHFAEGAYPTGEHDDAALRSLDLSKPAEG